MSDLIKREDAIAACDVLPKLYGEAIKIFIRRLPSEDRPQGEWIISYIGGIKQTECSACGESFITYDAYGWNYYPWCGARMKGADDADE